MPKTPVKTEDKTPKMLKPYVFHGVDFSSDDGAEAIGTCPFCGRDGKFYVQVETGVWQCKVCQTGNKKGGGNSITFVRELHAMSKCLGPDALKLSAARKLLSAKTLEAWGCVVSATTGEWAIPAHNHEGKLTQLYKYAKSGSKTILFGTPEMHAAMYGAGMFDKSKSETWVFEGPWDAMAAWEIVNGVKDESEKGWVPTANPLLTVGADVNIVAIPGAGVFQESWVPMFAGQRVTIFFDSDHPKEHNGRQVGLAGYNGARRTAGMLARPDGTGAKEVHVLQWGPDGYDPDKTSGWDVRDHVSQGNDLRTRASLLRTLVKEKVKPIPSEWVGGSGSGGKPSGEIALEDCQSWEEIREAWMQAIKFTPGHEYALASMLAVAVTTRVPGAQVWLQVISPPSTGKTTLSEGLGVNRKWTHSVDEFTGFFSGYTDGTDKDFSPIQKMKDKTLIIKEAANLLASDNRAKLLADLTATFDRKSGREWKNGKSVSEGGTNMTVILQGTGTLRQLETAETGARFLTCAIMNHIDDDLEDDILMRASFSAIRNMALESNCAIETHYEPDKLKAIQLTGGYLGWLRENSNELCAAASQNFPEPYRRLCCDYARAISYLRARPSKVQDETADREMAARLVEQITKLAIGYAVVTNKPGVDAHCMKWVRQIMLDSTYGKSYHLVKKLREYGGRTGLLFTDLNLRLNSDEKSMAPYRSFLCKIGVCEVVSNPVSQYSNRTIDRIRVTDKMLRLWDTVMKET